MSLSRFGSRIWLSMCKNYQAWVAAECNVYGLKIDDLMNEADPDVQKALARLSPEEQQLRARRLKRAFDINFKEKSLPEDLQKLQKPLEPYLQRLVHDAEARRIERDLLNTYK